MRITYQKKDGCIIQRFRSTMLPYKIGDTTSMCWKVLNIEYEYNNKYYSENEYNRLIQKDKQTIVKKKETAELFIKETKTFIYYLAALAIIKVLLGI